MKLETTRLVMLLLIITMNISVVFANYTGTYGKVDNLEIGFDMFLDFFIGAAPYFMYIVLALTIAWVVNKLLSV